MKRTLLAACTPKQAWQLEHNPHLLPLAYLDDGAMLIVDSDDFRRLTDDVTRPPLGPYILTTDGFLEEVTLYYLISDSYRGIRDTITAYQIPFSEWDGQTVDIPTRRKTFKVPPRKIAEIQTQIRKLSDELNEALYASKRLDLPVIHSPKDVAEILIPILSVLDREELWVVCLNTRNRIVHLARIYSGSVNQSQVRVGECFRPALIETAPSIILAHNHPSGDPTPSPEDISITRAIVQTGKLLDIEVLDHLVIGSATDTVRFVSLKERGLGF